MRFSLALALLLVPAALLAEDANKPILTLDAGGHTAPVARVLFTPDGKQLITVSHDQTIRLWNLATGETVRVLRPPIGKGDEGNLLTGALSPDGKTLAVAGYGNPADKFGTIYLIGLASNRIERVLKGHAGLINELAFAADGKRLASASDDKTARVWNVATGTCEQTLQGHGEILEGVAFAPDGNRLATASSDHTARVWAIATGKATAVLEHEQEVKAIAWSPDGKTIATGGREKMVRLWDANGSARGLIDKVGDEITWLTFTPDSCQLLLAVQEKGVTSCCLCDVAKGQKGNAFTRNGNTVFDGSVSPNGTLAATAGGNDNEVYVWKTADASVVVRLAGRGRRAWSAAWGPDGRTVAWGNTQTGDLYKLDVPLERAFRFSDLTFTATPDAAFRRAQPSLDGVSLVGHGTGAVTVKRGSAATVDLKLPNDDERAHSFTLLPEDRAVLGGSFGQYLFDIRSGTLRGEFVGHTGAIWALAPSPDNRFLLSASQDQTLRIWDASPAGTAPPAGVGVRFEVGDGGATITDVVADGPAARDGHLQRKDRLIAIAQADGGFVDIQKGKTFDDVSALVRGPQNSTVQLKVVPAGKTEPIAIKLVRKNLGQLGEYQRLVSLFCAGDDWIAWTPEGYYAASPGGERLMGWHVNRGPDQLALFHPADRFRASLNRPDVVRRVLDAGSVAEALKQADRERNRPSEPVTVAEVLPPTVVITAPDRSPLVVNKPNLEVRAVARGTAKNVVTALRLLLDGRPYDGQKGIKNIVRDRPGEKQGDVREQWNVTLARRTHRLAVQAESAVSKAVSDEVEVTFTAAQPPADSRPSLYMVALGVSAYPDKMKLNYAAKDARALEGVVKKKCAALFRSVDVHLLTDPQATRKSIFAELNWLKTQMTQRDVGIVSFSGHGVRDNDGTFYLAPVDIDPGDVVSSGVPGDTVKKLLAGMPGKLLLLLDACHAGSFDGDRRKSLGGLTDDLVRDLVTDDYGVVVMCSSTGREYSLEDETVSHGYFTKALLEGLSGEADYDKDGAVYLNELDTYVTDRVKKLSKGLQHPVTSKPASIRSFPLSKP
jgi:WD40 repeat protein